MANKVIAGPFKEFILRAGKKRMVRIVTDKNVVIVERTKEVANGE